MKIATITFHAAYNYGSVLQAYALQKFVTNISSNITYNVLNFRSNAQKSMYLDNYKESNYKNKIKHLILLPFKQKLRLKNKKFETFILKNLNITQEVNEENDIPEEWKEYDCYISGSDQIWNVRARDFSDVNFFDFVKEKKKISYAASFGPLTIDWKKYDVQRYKDYLDDFNSISVREYGSAEIVQYLTGRKSYIHIDPTMLLDVEDWRAIESDANYNNGKYILLYCLEPTKKQINMAKIISKRIHLPIVTLKPANKNDIINTFVKKYDAGPKDFLSYIDHASLVITSSFHGTVFAIIYNKPFFVLNGLKDKRISSLLHEINLESRSLEKEADIDRISLQCPNYKKTIEFLRREREKSYTYLVRALEIET